MDNKTDLRARFKTIRKSLDIQKISLNIEENIRLFQPYQNAENVMLFYPTKYEINLLGLLKDNKKFYFPRVKENHLLVCPYSKDTAFEKSEFNINEPCSAPLSPEILDLVIVPALAVDKNNYRLGYGGGFYDRFLKAINNAVSVVPIYHEFVVNSLPSEVFDVPVDFVITDAKKARV